MLTSIAHGRTGVTAAPRSRCVHRAHERFGPHPHSVNSALMFVREHLVAWAMYDKVPVASTVVAVFAENALTYTRRGFDVRLEGTDKEVIVAVSDASPTRRSGVNAGSEAARAAWTSFPRCAVAGGIRRRWRAKQSGHASGPTTLSPESPGCCNKSVTQRRERSVPARNAHRTAPRTGRGAPRRPTTREPIAPAGRGW